MDITEWDWSRHVVDHVHFRVADLAESKRFYAAVLEPLGVPLLMEHPGIVMFPNLALSDDAAPTAGAHLAFMAPSREAVDAFHRAGVDGGFRSNGEPGLRDYMPGYYAAYLLDPDGNNIEALHREVAG
jgi:catechol 2,3-dioxygenase-like lactoylglutathione lyase family enzyme